MSRRRKSEKRPVFPDPKYNNRTLSSFINRVMTRGKKSVAQRIVYGALDILEKETSSNPVETFELAIKNVTPQLEVKPRRVGGATYQVPVEVAVERQLALAMRWILRASRDRTGRPMAENLASELQEASRGQGAAVRRKEETHRMAEANRAFVHYRW